MDDMERYGDYNEVDEPPHKPLGLRLIKACALVICFSVIAFLGFRIFTFNYYPEECKQLYFTDGLTSHYTSENGEISIVTQELQAPYDDPNEGNIFCDHLRVVRDAGYLQITLRFNRSFEDTLLTAYTADVDLTDEDIFAFSLTRNGGESGVQTGKLVHVEWYDFMMYRYARLVFEEVDFGEGDSAAAWIRLETRIDGATYTDKDKVQHDKVFMNLIYEDHDTYSKFSDYELSKKELPQ